MKSKKKLIFSLITVSFILLSVVAAIAIAFALTQQTIKTTLNIGYTVEDIDGTAFATYTIGGEESYLIPNADADHIDGNKLVFKAGDTANAGNLLFPEGQIPLDAQNNNIVIKYTYSNTGERHYIASMDFDAALTYTNMTVEYSIDGENYSAQRYAVVVPTGETKSYWIKISITDLAKNASFTGDFEWLLEGCDEQSESYLSLTTLEFVGSDGAYSASIKADGEYTGQVTFPSSVNNDPVTEIVASSLTAEQKKTVTSVYIPSSVETIGESAFSGFTNLETVTFEQNESVSGASAQSVTGLTTIESKAFYDCNLTEFTFPSTLKSIGNNAFYGNRFDRINVSDVDKFAAIECASYFSTGSDCRYKLYENGELITNLELNETTSVGAYLFRWASFKNVTLGDSVTKVGISAFENTEIKESITIGKNLQTIGDRAFCTSVPIINFNSNKVTGTTANTRAFQSVGLNCKLIIGDNVTKIPDYLFYCSTAKEIKFGTGLTSVGVWAFGACAKLTTLDFGSATINFGYQAFNGCNNLERLNIASIENYAACTFPHDFSNPSYYADSVYINGELFNTAVIGEESDFALYAKFKNVIEYVTVSGSVTTIPAEAFHTWGKIKEMTLSDNVTTIGDYAFNGCSSLTDLTIGKNVKTMGTLILLNAVSLQNIYFNAVAMNDFTLGYQMGIGSADNCKVVFGESVTKIPASLLYGSSIKEVVIGNNVTKIGGSAFSGCSNLQVVTMGTSVNEIAYNAFYECTALNRVNIENLDGYAQITFAHIYANPINYAKNIYKNGELLNDLVLNSATKIVANAFTNADTIKTLTIGDSVATIGSSAFKGCTSLETVSVGSGVTSMGAFAFDGCTALTRVDIKDLDQYASITFGGTTSSPIVYAKNFYINGVLGENLVFDTAEVVSSYSFTNAECIKTVEIRNAVKVGGNVFQNCVNLTSVTLNEGIQDIQAFAFENTGLTQITLPSTLTKIRPYTFRNSKISTVVIPAAVWYVGHDAFKTDNITSISFEYTDNWITSDQYDETEDVAADVTDATRNATEMNSFAERTDYYNLDKQPTD